MRLAALRPVPRLPVGGDGDGGGGVGGIFLRYRKVLGALAVLAVLGIAVGYLYKGGFYATLVEDMLVYAIAAMGLDFLGGYGGLVSLGQAGFLGLGAYGIAVGQARGLGAWESVGLALLVVIVVGFLTAFVAVRVNGISFVIVTLAVGQIIWGLAFRWVTVSAGDNGLPISSYPSVGPIHLSDPLTLRMTVLGVFIVSAIVLRWLVSTPFGLSLQGVQYNEPRLKTLGYSTGLHRYLGYVISVFFGGVAGILYGWVNQLISPTTLDFNHNGIITIMAVLGGLGTLWGSVAGSVIIVLFQQELSLYVTRWETIMGVVFVAIVVFAPGGLWGVGRLWVQKLEARVARRTGRGGGTAALLGDAEMPGSAGRPQSWPAGGVLTQEPSVVPEHRSAREAQESTEPAAEADQP
ncbi:MAG: branched-chain amino acid ABC transporter permease [Acidimicrobiales bacterium]